MSTPNAPAYLITGDDPTLVTDAVITLVRDLVGDQDRSLLVEELTEESYQLEEAYDLARLIDAAQTMPFLTEIRVVVGRHLGRLSKADDFAGLIAYLADPLPSTRLVLVWERGENPRQDRLPAIPKKLLDALTSAGAQTISTAIPSGKGAGSWLDERLDDAAVRFDRGAKALIAEHLGEDRARIVGVLNVLEAAFAPRASLSAADIAPFLGEAGSVPPWELTDAIDRGDVAGSVTRAQRMLGAGERHPLQLIATLHTHYSRMLRLDGVAGLDERSAAARLGLKGSTFPAKKALIQAKRLGSARIGQAVGLLADADLALRGTLAWPPELVIEVLVARLARLNASAGAGGRRS